MGAQNELFRSSAIRVLLGFVNILDWTLLIGVPVGCVGGLEECAGDEGCVFSRTIQSKNNRY